MQTQLIILGHGHYASGMLSALELLGGAREEVKALDFTKDMSEEMYQEEIQSLIDRDHNYLLACDLLGGTPYKISARLKEQYSNIEVVTGANIGGLLDTSFKLKRLDLVSLAENLKKASIKNLMRISLQSQDDQISENGI